MMKIITLGFLFLVISASTSQAVLSDHSTYLPFNQGCNIDSIVQTMAFSPNSTYLVTGLYEGKAILWDMKTKSVIRRLDAHTEWKVAALAFSTDERYVSVGTTDGLVIIWKIPSGQQIHRFQRENTESITLRDEITDIVFTPDNNYVLIRNHYAAYLREVSSGKIIRTFSGESEYGDMSLSPNGQYLALGDGVIWDIYTGKKLYEFPSTGLEVFSPNGKYIATQGPLDITLWDTDEYKSVASFTDQTFLSFSPNGHFLLSREGQDTVHLWDVETKTNLVSFDDVFYYPWVFFLPDGKSLIYPSDNIIYTTQAAPINGDPIVLYQVKFNVWDIQANIEQGNSFTALLASGDVASISPDGKYLVAARADGLLVFWSLVDGEVIDRCISN